MIGIFSVRVVVWGTCNSLGGFEVTQTVKAFSSVLSRYHTWNGVSALNDQKGSHSVTCSADSRHVDPTE